MMLTPETLAGAVHEAIFPLPLATSPIAVLEFVHAKVEPIGLLTKLLMLIVELGHTAMFVIGVTTGLGKIVTVKVIGVPEQPFRVGVTEIIPTILAPVPLAGAVQEEILPVPLAESPIAVFEFVHAKVAPVGVLVKLLILMVVPEQTAIFVIGVTTGIGLIVKVAVSGGLTQLFLV